jgi:YfiH family protein
VKPHSLRQVPLLSRIPNVRHGFSSRQFGGDCVSRDPAAWREVVQVIHPAWRPENVARMEQVHGSEIVEVLGASGVEKDVVTADGMVTTTPNILLCVKVADCVPILCAAPGAVGVVHAGWRGVAQNIAVKGVQKLCAVADCVPSEVQIVLGPHICGRCYTVGEEVVTAIQATGIAVDRFCTRRDGAIRVDLGAAVEAQLRAIGVEEIEHEGRCTREDDLYSYRFDQGTSGRQFGFIGLLEPQDE